MRRLLAPMCALLLLQACDAPPPAARKAGVRSNVVYGRVANTALLMDVLVPQQSNHTAIIAIPGSGWGMSYPSGYDQVGLKDDHVLDSAYFGR